VPLRDTQAFVPNLVRLLGVTWPAEQPHIGWIKRCTAVLQLDDMIGLEVGRISATSAARMAARGAGRVPRPCSACCAALGSLRARTPQWVWVICVPSALSVTLRQGASCVGRRLVGSVRMQALSTAYKFPCPEDTNFAPISVNPNFSKFKSRGLSSLLLRSSGSQ
jgi:hypothetical protein